MLDDQAYIARFDSDNALAVAAGAPEQLLYDQFDTSGLKKARVNNIVITGMGGSALAALLTRSWLEDELRVPLVITRNYALPQFVDSRTLVIVSSYSGNTEETLAALADAQAKKAQIVAVTNGGKLAKAAEVKGYPCLKLPQGYQPRTTANFGIRVFTAVLEKSGLISDKTTELTRTHQLLADSAKAYLPQNETVANPAKQIAERAAGKSVIVYASPLLGSAAYKWKANFNENAKNLAFCNELPEFNHNEFIGWTAQPTDKLFAVFELSSSFDHPQVSKRFEITNRLLSGKMPAALEIKAQGKSKLEQILWTVQLGDFASIYLGILNGLNPTPVDLVEKFKSEL